MQQIHLKTASSEMPVTGLDEDDLLELLYQERSGALTTSPEILEAYIAGCEKLGLEQQFFIQQQPASVEAALKQWNMPNQYNDIDLDLHFAEKIETMEQAERVATELILYRENGLETMLKFMIYMVDVMKAHNIIWGVGRGSSVSSYLLFLIGLHSVDSLKYDLDIREFIK